MKILALETSCDDTSVAILENGNIVLSSVVSSQVELHREFGGVVPEVAAREHVRNMIPVLDEAFSEASTKLNEINYIAVTKGPGLIGSLIVGVNTARFLSSYFKLPLFALHHIEGHIYANWLLENLKDAQKPPAFPLICLTVSGGHSNLIYMKKHLDYQIVGETQDDAAGEAFDKVAKMLQLGYPGGPIISKYAQRGSDHKFNFPRVDLTPAPYRDKEGYLKKPDESLDFSFSGLKTAVLKEVKGLEATGDSEKSDIAASFQLALNETLTRNLLRAVRKYQPKSVLLSGGVAANSDLKSMIEKIMVELKTPFYFPKPKYCTDNAAMIGAAAFWHIQKGDTTDPKKLVPEPNSKLT